MSAMNSLKRNDDHESTINSNKMSSKTTQKRVTNDRIKLPEINSKKTDD